MTPNDFLAQIEANIDDCYEDRKSFEAFTADAREIWTNAEEAGMGPALLTLMAEKAHNKDVGEAL